MPAPTHPMVPTSRSLTSSELSPSSLRPVLWLWGVIALALVAELLGFTLLFPVHRLIKAAGLGSMALNRSMLTPRLIASGFLTGATATLLFGANRLGGWLRAEDRSRWFPSTATVVSLVGHLVALTVFLATSSHLLAIDQSGSLASPVMTVAWLTSGVALVVLALAVALPPSRWWPLARAIPGAIAAGVGVGLATPAASLGTTAMWSSLGKWTVLVVVTMLRLVSDQVSNTPGQLTVGVMDFEVDISPECSGFEGIGLVLAFLVGFLWYEREQLRFPIALILLPVGAVAIWLCNAVRIVALILIGAHGYPRLAVEGFHSQAGSIGFVAITLGMVFLSRARIFRVDSEKQVASKSTVEPSTNPAAAYLVPQLAIIGASMLGGIFMVGDGLDRGYPLKVVAGLVAFAWFWRSYRAMAWSWSWSWVGPASGLLVFVLWMAMEPSLKPTGPPRALRELPRFWAAAWVVCRVVGSVALVPVAEEVAFRGFLARRLMASDFEGVSARRLSWFAMIVSTACFAALHGRWLAGGVAGMIYALTYRYRGNLADAAIAHAVTNGLIATYVLTMGTWSLW